MTFFISNAQAIINCNSVAQSIDAGAGAGKLKIYAGTVPLSLDHGLSGNLLLATLTFSDPAFGGAVDQNPGAIATANAISNDTAADATGTASFFRATDSNDVDKGQGSVTATGGGGDLQLSTVSIVANAIVSVTSLTLRQPESIGG